MSEQYRELSRSGRRVVHPLPSRARMLENAALGLGLVSLGIGLAELFAGRPMARKLVMRNGAGLLQAY